MLKGNEMNLNKIFERMGEKIIAKTQTKNKYPIQLPRIKNQNYGPILKPANSEHHIISTANHLYHYSTPRNTKPTNIIPHHGQQSDPLFKQPNHISSVSLF